jgi:signal peptidase I
MEIESRRATKRRWVTRGLIAALAGVVALVVVEVDVYRVTGSSMRPVLDGATNEADYIVALAHSQYVRAPRRFDIVIHDRPASVKNVAEASDLGDDRCVKRIVAFPGERPVIRDGDLFIEAIEDGVLQLSRARRYPDTIRAMTSVVDALRSAIHPGSRFMPSGAIYFDEDSWHARSNGSTDSMPTRLEYDGLIPDTQIGRDGAFDPNGIAVNDTGLEMAIANASEDLELVVELREQGDVFRVHLGRQIGLRIEYRRGAARHEVLFSSKEDILLPSPPFVLRTLNCDDRILVWLNDDLLCDQEYGHNEDVFGVARNDPSLEVLAGTVEFTSISILRDAYYLTETPLSTRGERFDEVPIDAYFMLGDNSRKSIDSRDFGPVDQNALRGFPWLRQRPGYGWSRL